MTGRPDVSIIIPCYNEAGHLRRNFEEIRRTMSDARFSYEIIFVEDAGADETREIIKDIANENESVRYEFHERNRGRGGAVKTGLALARAPIAGFLDLDLEVHCRYIPPMVHAILDGADIACGRRVYRVPFRFDDLLRDTLSAGYRFLARRLLGLPELDTEAGYKFFNVEKTRPLIALTENDHWFWDTEIMTLAVRRGFRIAQVPMVYIRREDKVSTVRPLADSIDSLKSLLRFRRRFRRGLPYRSPRLYHLLMKFLYRDGYAERYEAIAELVPPGSSVLDVCCGDGRLFESCLARKGVSYIGLDINPAFIGAAASKGIDVRGFDIELRDDLPAADVVVIQSSLYQFIPGHEKIIRKLLRAARSRVIISEPVRNYGSSANPLVRRLTACATNPGTGPKHDRFTPDSLDAALAPFRVLNRIPVCSGREMICILDPVGESK